MKKTGVRIFVLLLAAVMLLSVLMPTMSMLAGAVTAGEIQDMKDNLSDVKNQKADLEKQLDQIQDDMATAEEKLSILQDQILLTEQQIYESQKLLDSYDRQIEEKQAEITELEEQENKQYDQFYAQTRWMEENGGTSVISVLFQASSFSELLDYLALVTDIMNYNDRIITQLENTRKELAEARDELQQARDGQAAIQSQLESARADLASQKAEADQYYSQLQREEKEYDSKVARLAADLEDIEADLKDAEKKYQEQLNAAQKPSTGGGGSVVDPTGTWYWPLPGYYYISSVYGGRYNPIYGTWETHRGADIPAPGGTPVQAASSGVVTTAKYGASYGNYCVIYHGNGYATLYAHMQSLPSVSVGDVVSAGQVIGYVGSTGDSTGNHLHFELTINGSLANALDLYPNLSFSGL